MKKSVSLKSRFLNLEFGFSVSVASSHLSFRRFLWKELELRKSLIKKRGAPEEGRGLGVALSAHFHFGISKICKHPSVAFQKKKTKCHIQEKPGIWISKFCFTYSKEAFLGIWKKSQKNLELVKLLQYWMSSIK